MFGMRDLRYASRLEPRFVRTHTRYRSVIFASLIAFFDFARRISFRHNHIMRTSLQASSTYLHSFMLVAHRLLNTHTPRTSCKRRPSRSPCSAVAPVLACATSGLLAPGSTSYKTNGSSAACSIYLLSVGDEWANDALARRGRVWAPVLILQGTSTLTSRWDDHSAVAAHNGNRRRDLVKHVVRHLAGLLPQEEEKSSRRVYEDVDGARWSGREGVVTMRVDKL